VRSLPEFILFFWNSPWPVLSGIILFIYAGRLGAGWS